MISFGTLGAYNVQKNIPNAVAHKTMPNGTFVTLNDTTNETEDLTSSTCVSKSVMLALQEFTGDLTNVEANIEEGKYVRLFVMSQLGELSIYASDDMVTYSTPADYSSVKNGDMFELDANGKFVSVSSPTGKLYFVVEGKGNFGSYGKALTFRVKVID